MRFVAAVLAFLLLSVAALGQSDPMKPALDAIAAKNYALAATLLQPMAEGGDPNAQQLLAGLYEHGLGVPLNLATAASWYERSAQLGLPFGQLMIGDMLMVGAGVARDPDKALMWYRKAAGQGFVEAEFRVAMLLQEGDQIGGPFTSGTPTEDLAEAVSWYKKAADAGMQRATLRLDAIVLEDPWPGEAVDAFTLVEARAAKVAASASRSLAGSHIKLDYLPLGPGTMVSPAWDPEHADQVYELASLFVSKTEEKLKSTEHADLPNRLAASSRGKCEPSASSAQQFYVTGPLLSSSADPEKSVWFGAIEQDHIVIGTPYSDVDDYYGLVSFFAHGYYGDWTGTSAELWNPSHSCSITVTSAR